MTSTLDHASTQTDREDVSARLLDSVAQLSYDPAVDVDWEEPLDPALHGVNPQWCSLYGTALWEEMTDEQRVTLTRHEVCSIMSTGIWFEMILQQMVLRDQYCKDSSSSDFRFALTEIADECRHSMMFARVCQRMDIKAYLPNRVSIELGRVFKALASSEAAYGGILVAEEVLDVMQRDWMRGVDVLPLVRTTSRIHVVEESRHMTFARQQMRERIEGTSRARRKVSGFVIASAAYFIVSNMVNPGVYEAAGLDRKRAVREAAGNEHHHAMMRTSSQHLTAFLRDCGLLSAPAAAIYRRLHML